MTKIIEAAVLLPGNLFQIALCRWLGRLEDHIPQDLNDVWLTD